MNRRKSLGLTLAAVFVSAAACAHPRDVATSDSATGGMNHMHGDSMPGMSMGMDMGKVVIPPGARFNEADVRFMQGMIAHHGQAVVMAGMAKSHGAMPKLLQLTMKIDQSQRGEIQLMQTWLQERNQVTPEPDSYKHMSMPGMLTAEQLAKLDSARGKEFDKLFLEYMIMHHEGALKMVADLQAAPLSMQDALLSEFAGGIDSDQRAEIGKMHEMLGEMK